MPDNSLTSNKSYFSTVEDEFKELRDRQTEIEAAFGDTLEWEALSNGRASRIASYYPEDVRVRDRERWGALRAWAISRMGVFKQTLQPHIDALP